MNKVIIIIVYEFEFRYSSTMFSMQLSQLFILQSWPYKISHYIQRRKKLSVNKTSGQITI